MTAPTAPLSEERRAEIESMLEAITPYPWKVTDKHPHRRIANADDARLHVVRWMWPQSWTSDAQNEANADFIAAAPAIIRELLAALDAEHRATLHAEVAADRLWQAYDEMQEMTLPPPYRRRTREQIVGLVPLDTTREGE